MTSKLLTADEYETLFRHWKIQHGELGKEFNGRQPHQVPARSPARIDMYMILVNDLIKTYNYTEENLRDPRCFDRIINTSVPLKYKNKKALENWKNFATTDLNIVIDSFFQRELAQLTEKPVLKNQSIKIAEPYEKKSRADIIPDVPMLDKSILVGPEPVTVIDESVDIFALSGDGNDT